MSQPFIGEIKIFAGNFAPRDYAFCNGQLLQIAQNTALFAVVGTIYGGDGRTTLGLPNLQGRAPMHPGAGPGLTPRILGQQGGAETVTLNDSQMPAHQHTLQAEDEDASQTDPTNRAFATTDDDFYEDPGNVVATPVAMAAASLGSAGSGNPHNNMQPYLVLNFIIALNGVFPSRG